MTKATAGPIRRTKIVATLGPASDKEGVLDAMVHAGVDVVRINFSHGSAEDHRRRVMAVREAAKNQQRNVAILGDLQGPKIRIARFVNGSVELENGQNFALDINLGRDDGNEHQVGCDYRELADDVKSGDVLLLDDGRVVLEVQHVDGGRIECTVKVGGKLSNNKGINKQGGGLSAAALTDKDREDMKTAIDLEVDFLAVSFPRSGADMQLARDLLGEAGKNIALVAKVERAEAVANETTLDEIIIASDAVMVARGDLGVEIGDAQLIGVQKRMIARARTLNRAVITATQMMESMIESPLPTRAEVFDVANAVLDGTDAVMLSAETAAGSFPVETIEAMNRCCMGAERERAAQESKHRMADEFHRIDETVALSAMYAANHLEGVAAIACLTETGYTPLIASRIRSGLPIVALSSHPRTLRRMALYRGVFAIEFNTDDMPNAEVNQRAVSELEKRALANPGDYVILTRGDHVSAQGGTNAMKIVQVGEHIG
ncbi:pyruvate kinase [uncultured Kushneria sp.]|uniref:pyruvate kinase n=1 Tax=uncultured Kushneria sp. TaxID=905033 RepID=UPI0026125C54|nr:pyruvate kinase [uncultured Kushneria sp.]